MRTDPAAFREVFGREEVYSTVQHASRAVAVANIHGCDYGPSRCQHAVLLTTDRWAHQIGVVVDSDDAFGVEVHVLPEGAVAVVGAQRGDEPMRPFILHASGVITALKLSTDPGAPGRGTVLVPRPEQLVRPRTGAIWVIGPARHVLHPSSVQPCVCTRWFQSATMAQPSSGTAYAAILDGITDTRDGWVDLRISHDSGRSWNTRNLLPANLGAYNSGLSTFALDRPPHLAAVWTSDSGTDYPRFRPWVSHDGGRTWRRIDNSAMPHALRGVATVRGGTVLFGVGRGGDLWRLSPRARGPQLVRDAPRVAAGLSSSGGVAVIGTGERTIAESVDGRHWLRFTLGEGLAAGISTT